MTDVKKVVGIESAAQICGYKLDEFKRRLALPEEHPKAFKTLHLIDNEYLDVDAVETFAKRSRERQGQSPILADEIIEDKLKELIHEYEGEKRAAMLAISYFAGLRVGEIANLKIDQLIEHDGTLKETSILYRSDTKTRKDRIIFLGHPVLIEYVNKWLKIRITENTKHYENVFLKIRDGLPYTNKYLSIYFKRIYRFIDTPQCSSHSGRSATVVRQLRAGKGLKYAALFVGHTSTNTTANYDRVNASDIIQDLRGLKDE